MAGKKKACVDGECYQKFAKQVAKQVAKQTREEFFSSECELMQAKMNEIIDEFKPAARFKVHARKLRLLTLDLTKMMKTFRDESMRMDEGPNGKRIPAEKK